MTTIGLLVLVAALAQALGFRFKIPLGVLGILGGILLTFMPLELEQHIVRNSLMMSATFLVFAVGAEMDRYALAGFRPVATGLAVVSFVTTALVGLGLYFVLNLSVLTALYLVVAASGSSALLVFELLRRREEFFEPVGRVATSGALMQDFVVILALSAIVLATGDAGSAWVGAFGLLGIAGAAWLCVRWVGPWVVLLLKLDEEEKLLFILLVLFLLMGVARLTDLPLVVGAYFAGMALSRFPVGDLARSSLTSFSDFFSMLFYVALGLTVTVPTTRALLAEGVLILAVLLLRPLVLLPVLRRRGLTVRSSLEAATLLGQTGELGLVVALLGVAEGHIGNDTLGIITALVVVTMASAPWLSSDAVVWRLTHLYPFRGKPLPGGPPEGHILLIGGGETATVLLEHLRERSIPALVIEEDPAVVRELASQGVRVLRGNGANPRVLRAAGAAKAKAVVTSMRRQADNARLLSELRGGPKVLVRVFSEAEAERVRGLGGQPVIEAELALEQLLSWRELAHEDRALGPEPPTGRGA